MAGQTQTVIVTIDYHLGKPNSKGPYKILAHDETGTLAIVFFHAHQAYLKKVFIPGQTIVISGKVDVFQNAKQIAHPDYIGKTEQLEKIAVLEPIYSATEAVESRSLRRLIQRFLQQCPTLPEWIDPHLIQQQNWPDWLNALWRVHDPQDQQANQPQSKYRQRLAYDEALAHQCALHMMRQRLTTNQGRSYQAKNHYLDQVKAKLPFELTQAQLNALTEIFQDLQSPNRMVRLLQGDVGSGKTLVALLAMAYIVESGHQTALMVPTDILARQHFQTFSHLFEGMPVHVRLLTGRDKGKARQKILQELQTGQCHILIGTHAVFQDDVIFHDLGLAVIDEQHRFGVHQRLHLSNKGAQADILLMSATPIPRTMLLSLYGDIDVSQIHEKPLGRKPIQTQVLPLSRLSEVMHSLKRPLHDGQKIYWVCPLIEASQKIDLAAAEERFAQLRQVFGDRVGLVHGRMKDQEKDAMMQCFSLDATHPDRIDILVSTTVIEVGVDVKAATIMVIDHAERFGLAQLHQLRGRIGRNDISSYCLLLYDPPLNPIAEARLRTMRSTNDGFVIAEEDLRLRGGGEILGTKQSGLPDFKLIDLNVHTDLLKRAQQDAKLLLSHDPDLQSDRGQAIRLLLQLFGKEDALAFVTGG